MVMFLMLYVVLLTVGLEAVYALIKRILEEI